MRSSDDAPAGARGGDAAGGAPSRDAQAAAVLGWFHLALALPVLAGTAFADLAIDRVLNVAAAAALGTVGGCLLRWSRRLARRGTTTERR